jgi:hypothetical protein
LTLACELGYAPTTPTRAAMDFPGDGNTGGLAWNVTVSGMNLKPNHSIGLNFAQTDAGWLISSDFKPNTQIVELRYLWRKSHNLALDIRFREESDLELTAGAVDKQKNINVFARFTRGFD